MSSLEEFGDIDVDLLDLNDLGDLPVLSNDFSDVNALLQICENQQTQSLPVIKSDLIDSDSKEEESFNEILEFLYDKNGSNESAEGTISKTITRERRKKRTTTRKRRQPKKKDNDLQIVEVKKSSKSHLINYNFKF